MATIRNLKIKTASCKRIVKELHSYEKEVEREAAKTADMKEKGADPYDLKQQENVLAESRMMIPDCRKRLESSLADLKGILAELEEANQKEGPEVTEAESTIVDVEKLFETTESYNTTSYTYATCVTYSGSSKTNLHATMDPKVVITYPRREKEFVGWAA
ncbi:hypothetical protein L1987_77097 [Smallanthus sonchifolius]|uniref:Uncharacterized protein n=1 Tax=Smallanthus sonchifolius TaxID=185202 RepID=A0ACB8Z9W5_9ASTR|nr:hypothetical protein L1987_77097 [Smallanthus sonchifolius]